MQLHLEPMHKILIAKNVLARGHEGCGWDFAA